MSNILKEDLFLLFYYLIFRFLIDCRTQAIAVGHPIVAGKTSRVLIELVRSGATQPELVRRHGG